MNNQEWGQMAWIVTDELIDKEEGMSDVTPLCIIIII